jgi:hypothetical protein
MSEASRMSRYTGMSTKAKRLWGLGLILFFILLCGMIGFSEWWAYHVNVPYYERTHVPGAAH